MIWANNHALARTRWRGLGAVLALGVFGATLLAFGQTQVVRAQVAASYEREVTAFCSTAPNPTGCATESGLAHAQVRALVKGAFDDQAVLLNGKFLVQPAFDLSQMFTFAVKNVPADLRSQRVTLLLGGTRPWGAGILPGQNQEPPLALSLRGQFREDEFGIVLTGAELDPVQYFGELRPLGTGQTTSCGSARGTDWSSLVVCEQVQGGQRVVVALTPALMRHVWLRPYIDLVAPAFR